MKKTIFFLVGIMMVSSIGFSAEKKSLESNLSTIESQFNELMRKEDAQKQSYIQQKAQLEKLRVDSEVRWHRDKYKKILNNSETVYKNINKSIAEKEKKIAELDALLSVMN